MMYQRISIASAEPVGDPAPLPAALVGLADESLVDLPAALYPCPTEWLDTGFLPIDIVEPAFDPATEALSAEFASRELDAVRKVVVATRGTRPLTSEELAAYRDSLRAHAADVRWRKESGGVAVEGVPILTDRESQAMINGAVALVDKVPETIVRFKSAAGFVELDGPTITAIAIAVGQHVQSCFETEGEVDDAITAGAITTREEVEAAFAA